ncbi:armadillo-type protein, partial [Mycena metata]
MEDAAVTVAQMCIDIAVLDPIRPGIYARLCLALSERLRAPRQEIFIEELLNKLGADFDAGYDARTPPHLQATARRKYVGLVRFLVAVYEVCMLEEATIHDCVKILFESSSEADMEALCVILNASGPLLDTSAAAADLDDYFSRISEWCLDVKVPIRIRFMLQDLSDRRAHKWVEAERNHLDIIVAMPLEPDPEEGKYLNDAILAVKVQSVFPPDQDLRLACRDPEYVPTLITLLVQEVISSQDENIMALVSKFLEFVLSHDLVLTSAVVFGFVLALKDRHLPRDALRPLRHLVNAAGLDDERGEGILDRAVAAASEDSPEVPVEDHHLHLNPSEAQGTFDAIAAALSLPAPILPSQERVPCDLFVVWLARIKELKDEASRRRQEVADIRADRRLAKILDAAQKLTDKRDTAEKKRAVEQSLRVSAENALNTQKAANLTMENDLREVRARCTEIEAELQRIKVRNTVEVASADTSRDDGRD